jgi:hypothetical protein
MSVQGGPVGLDRLTPGGGPSDAQRWRPSGVTGVGATLAPRPVATSSPFVSMALIDSCWRLRDGGDHIEVEAYPRCVAPEQRLWSLIELYSLIHRFEAKDPAVRKVMLDVHGRLSGRLAVNVDLPRVSAAMRTYLVAAAAEGNLVVRRSAPAELGGGGIGVEGGSGIRVRTRRNEATRTEFCHTPSGKRLLENTLPGLVNEVARLAAAIEALVAQQAQTGMGQQR